jgi:hypothetical protein
MRAPVNAIPKNQADSASLASLAAHGLRGEGI